MMLLMEAGLAQVASQVSFAQTSREPYRILWSIDAAGPDKRLPPRFSALGFRQTKLPGKFGRLLKRAEVFG